MAPGGIIGGFEFEPKALYWERLYPKPPPPMGGMRCSYVCCLSRRDRLAVAELLVDFLMPWPKLAMRDLRSWRLWRASWTSSCEYE